MGRTYIQYFYLEAKIPNTYSRLELIFHASASIRLVLLFNFIAPVVPCFIIWWWTDNKNLMGTERSKIVEEVRLPATAVEIWELIGDFNGIPAWHPMIVDSFLEKNGKVRRIIMADEGGESLERLLHYSKSQMSYYYTVLQGPMPVSEYRATISVQDTLDDNALVRWEAEFVADGASQEGAEKEVRYFFQMGMDSLKEIFK